MIRALATAVALAMTGPARAEIGITPVPSPGGVTAWLYEARTVPILTIEASFQGGSALDPAGAEGVARLMTALLDQGSGDLDATGFAEAREDLAARIGFSASRDEVKVSVTMLAEKRDATIDLVRAALLSPRFDTEAVERVRRRTLSSIRRSETEPRSVAGLAFRSAAFAGHPYGRPLDGTIESVSALDAAALRGAHAAAFARDRLRVAVVGAISPDELGPVLDRLFGALPASGPALPDVASPVMSGQTTVIALDIPQSVVTFGHGGIARSDPDFVAAVVLDHVLGGGGFSSRLMREMREVRGLTYGVRTNLAPGDFGSLYTGSFSTANARLAEAIGLVRAEWARMSETGVTEAELTQAKRYLTGEYPLRFDGNARIAGQLLGLQTAGLDIGYVNIRNDLVQAVTAQDVARVARRLLRPELLTMVVVGKPEGLAAGN